MNFDNSEVERYIRYSGYSIWRAPRDFIITDKISYRKKVCLKIKYCREHITYLKEQIAKPNLSEETKEFYYYPSLERELVSLKIFEKQASLLAA